MECDELKISDCLQQLMIGCAFGLEKLGLWNDLKPEEDEPGRRKLGGTGLAFECQDLGVCGPDLAPLSCRTRP
jgi:hypothetical protein